MAHSKTSIENIIRKYLNRLNNNNIHVTKAILFGSYAKGTPGESSDIDIAIISEQFKGDRYSDRRLIVPFRRGIDSKIEPMPFRPEDFSAGGMLIDEIKKTGTEIAL